MTEVESELSGIARCPYDPRFNATALLTKEGDLYSGTVMDFTARDPVVYRTLGPSPALRTAQLNSKWLSGKAICVCSFLSVIKKEYVQAKTNKFLVNFLVLSLLRHYY